jgi:hypothetical protein
MLRNCRPRNCWGYHWVPIDRVNDDEGVKRARFLKKTADAVKTLNQLHSEGRHFRFDLLRNLIPFLLWRQHSTFNEVPIFSRYTVALDLHLLAEASRPWPLEIILIYILLVHEKALIES